MITVYRRCEVFVKEAKLPSNLFFDTITKEYMYSNNRINPRDEYINSVIMHILHSNVIIASSDNRTKIQQIPLSFLKMFKESKGIKNCTVKFVDNKVFTDENNCIIVNDFRESFDFHELVEIANAYPNDADLGGYIRNELLKL